jgi:predicted RNA-binding protein (virulence factor B family)
LEGDGITPELAAQQWYDGVEVENGVVRSVFLVEDQLDMLWSKQSGDKDKVDLAALNEQRRWAELSWQYGQWLKKEAQSRKLPVLVPRPWPTLPARIKEIL